MNQRRTPRLKRTGHLKPLLEAVPPGFMVDTRWLRARGIDPKSIHNYVARGWLERVVRGVYRRPLTEGLQENPDEPWAIPLLSLQRLMKYDVHLGAESALDIAGHQHYVFRRRTRIHLYGDVPTWLKRLPMKAKILVRRRKLFDDHRLGVVGDEPESVWTRPRVGLWTWRLRRSGPERAFLEALDELPRNESFDTLDRIFQLLSHLQPDLLQALLRSCRSVKVRRLFFVYADRHPHGWLEHLDTSKIDFGSGPRSLVEGGRFHPTYRIQLPAFLVPGTEEWISAKVH